MSDIDPNNVYANSKSPSSMTQAETMHEIMTPVFQDESNGIISKDLRHGNLTFQQEQIAREYTDVALQLQMMGCEQMATHLIFVRDTMLGLSASRNGFERRTQVTTVNTINLPHDRPKPSLWSGNRNNNNNNNR